MLHPAFLVALALALFPAPAAAQETGQTIRRGKLVDHDYGFALERPSLRWQLASEEEIKKIVPDAVAGMHSLPKIYGVVIVERLQSPDLARFADHLIDGMPLEGKRVVSRSDGELLERKVIRRVGATDRSTASWRRGRAGERRSSRPRRFDGTQLAPCSEPPPARKLLSVFGEHTDE